MPPIAENHVVTATARDRVGSGTPEHDVADAIAATDDDVGGSARVIHREHIVAEERQIRLALVAQDDLAAELGGDGVAARPTEDDVETVEAVDNVAGAFTVLARKEPTRLVEAAVCLREGHEVGIGRVVGALIQTEPEACDQRAVVVVVVDLALVAEDGVIALAAADRIRALAAEDDHLERCRRHRAVASRAEEVFALLEIHREETVAFRRSGDRDGVVTFASVQNGYGSEGFVHIRRAGVVQAADRVANMERVVTGTEGDLGDLDLVEGDPAVDGNGL